MCTPHECRKCLELGKFRKVFEDKEKRIFQCICGHTVTILFEEYACDKYKKEL